jgi:hypothetical protein
MTMIMMILTLKYCTIGRSKLNAQPVDPDYQGPDYRRKNLYFFSRGAAALLGAKTSYYKGFEIHTDTPQYVGLLWKRDRLVRETST